MEEDRKDIDYSIPNSTGFYKPSTEDTSEAYQALLSIVEQQLGGHPSLVIRGVADEVLSVLKNPALVVMDKKAEIERLLNPIADHIFEQLVLTAELIKDYSQLIDVHENGFYQPMKEETWVAYKLLLSVVEDQLQPCHDHHQPQIVHCLVAHEILLILKNESVKHPETRREMIENLLNRIPDHTYNLLVFLGRLIQDFKGLWDADLPRIEQSGNIGSSLMEDTMKSSDRNQVSQLVKQEKIKNQERLVVVEDGSSEQEDEEEEDVDILSSFYPCIINGGRKQLDNADGKGSSTVSIPPCSNDPKPLVISALPDHDPGVYVPPRIKKNGSSSSWSINDPVIKRKKRVAKYKLYEVEGKAKASFIKVFRWIKNKWSDIIHGV